MSNLVEDAGTLLKMGFIPKEDYDRSDPLTRVYDIKTITYTMPINKEFSLVVWYVFHFKDDDWDYERSGCSISGDGVLETPIVTASKISALYKLLTGRVLQVCSDE
jgi:hypothetical protein